MQEIRKIVYNIVKEELKPQNPKSEKRAKTLLEVFFPDFICSDGEYVYLLLEAINDYTTDTEVEVMFCLLFKKGRENILLCSNDKTVL